MKSCSHVKAITDLINMIMLNTTDYFLQIWTMQTDYYHMLWKMMI